MKKVSFKIRAQDWLLAQAQKIRTNVEPLLKDR